MDPIAHSRVLELDRDFGRACLFWMSYVGLDRDDRRRHVDKDGLARENIKSFMPRADPNYSDRKTDIFALSSAFYYIMQGHEPFPDLDPFDDEELIEARLASRQFPELESLLMNRVTHKCWAGDYDSA